MNPSRRRMEGLRTNAVAIVAGILTALIVAAVIDLKEVMRVSAITRADGYDDDSWIVFTLVIASTFLFTAVVLAVSSIVRRPERIALVVIIAIPMSLFASLPVYWYTYRDAQPGWHINIAEEHRNAPSAGVVGALIAYGISRSVVAWRRRRNPGKSSLTHA